MEAWRRLREAKKAIRKEVEEKERGEMKEKRDTKLETKIEAQKIRMNLTHFAVILVWGN
jgi:hypothetical protein